MAKDKLNINVEGFGLSATARGRVKTALNKALATELKGIGKGKASEGVFGDGSVKGMPQGLGAKGLAGKGGNK